MYGKEESANDIAYSGGGPTGVKRGLLSFAAAFTAAVMLTACTSASAQYETGIAKLKQGEYEAAADCFMETLENLHWYDGIDKTEVLLYRGEALLGEGEYESARKVYEGLAQKDTENADYPFYSGIASMGAEDYDAAEASFLIAAEKGRKDAYGYAGQAAEAQGYYKEAVGYYEQALLAQPDQAKLYAAIGRCRIETGDYTEALHVLEEGISAAQNAGKGDAQLQTLLWEQAVAYEYAGDFDAAREKFAAYVQQYPDDEAAQKEYAFLQTR